MSGSGCFAMAQTDTQTHGHGDSMTNSAQWGRVGENKAVKKVLTKICHQATAQKQAVMVSSLVAEAIGEELCARFACTFYFNLCE